MLTIQQSQLLEKLLKENEKLLWGRAWKLAKENSDDLFGEFLYRITQAFPRYNPKRSFDTWACAILKYTWYDMLKWNDRYWGWIVTGDHDLSYIEARLNEFKVEASAEEVVVGNDIQYLIEKLPTKLRRSFVMSIVGLSCKEAGILNNVNPKHEGRRRCQARELLKEMLNEPSPLGD